MFHDMLHGVTVAYTNYKLTAPMIWYYAEAAHVCVVMNAGYMYVINRQRLVTWTCWKPFRMV